MNYYQIRNKRLLQAYAYDKRKKELKDGRDKRNNSEERPRKGTETEKTTIKF